MSTGWLTIGKYVGQRGRGCIGIPIILASERLSDLFIAHVFKWNLRVPQATELYFITHVFKWDRAKKRFLSMFFF